jgi:hypothetical protein
MNLFRYIPIKIPRIDRDVNFIKNNQSIVRFCMSPINPISEFIAIINSDVPTAFFIGSLANNTNDGIIKKPPPAPTNPIITPIIKF